jgi:hypothetical protein
MNPIHRAFRRTDPKVAIKGDAIELVICVIVRSLIS